MARQGLTAPAGGEREYVELVRVLQPVAPVADSRPGLPPRLVHRTRFDDGRLADAMRGRGELVKGRFRGGNIGYVLAGDLELYGAAFRKELARFSEIQEQVYRALRNAGPLTPRQLKEETGMLNRQIMPALHRLQQAFLVYEAQEDSSWERAWSLFAAEWPDVDLERRSREDAAGEVLVRLLQSLVFATFAQLRDGSQFAIGPLRGALEALERGERAVSCEVSGLGKGWILPEDRDLAPSRPERMVRTLHRADPLVHSHISELKERFAGREVLQYLLIDGELCGAVCGHWRIGPHDVEDIEIDLPAAERAARRDEILAQVERVYRPPSSRIRRYAGDPL
jgi:hypothetical protein